MAAPVAGLFATLGLDDGPWAAGLRRASQQARDFRSVQEREFRATTAATEGMSHSMRGSLGNVAQQIQDVAVQFQSGTSAAVIFAQQGPQILSAFGPLGGMFGALAGVTAVAAGALLGLGKEADSAKAASNALESATKTLDSAIAGSATSVDDLAGKYRVLSEEMRALERLKLEKVIRDSTTAIEEQKKALAESVRNLVDPKQLDVLERAAKIGQQLNPQYQAPAAAQDNLKFLQDTAKAAKEALDRGDFVGLAKQVDQFAKSSASAEKAFRGFAEGMIGPAESVIKANDAIEKANEGLGQLASGGPAGSGRARDPFAGFKDAPKELSRVREEIQRGLDSIAQTVAEKKAVVDREFAETASAITKQRSVPGADQHLLDEVEAQAKRLHQARLDRIDEEAAKEAEAEKKRVAAASRRTEALAREIEQNQRLIDAGKQSADAYEQMRRVIEAENKAIAAGLDPKGREARILAEQTKALDEQTEARKRNARAAEEQAKAHEKFYDDIGKRIGGMLDESAANENRQAENLQQNLQQNVASAVERGFQDGFASTDQIVAQFGSLLTSTIASSVASTVVTDGLAKSLRTALGGSLGELIPSLAGTGAGAASVTGLLGAGAFGAIGGSLFGSLTGRNTTYSGIGGGLGAAAGFAFGGPWGAALGAAGGSLLGGLLGGSAANGGTRNNNFMAGFDPLTGLPVEFQNTRPDPQNQSAVAAVLAELQTLRAGLRSTGVGFGDIGDLVIQAGNKTGLTLNGTKYDSQSALTEAALRQLLTGAEGLSAGQQTVLANSKAKDAAGLLTDLSIPEQLANLLNPMTTFSTALKEQTRLYAEANDNATRLGLSTKGLSEAQERDRQKLVDAYKAELGLLSPVEVQIRSVIDTFEQAIRSVKELGVSEELLVRQRDKQLAAIRDQLIAQREQAQAGFVGNVQQRFGYVDQFRQFQDSLAVSNDNGTAQTRLREAQRQFELVRRGALVGDVDALGQLTQVGQSYITAARDYGGSGAVFQDAFKSVNDVLTKSIERGETMEERLLDGIQGQTKTITDFYRELMAERRNLQRTLDAIERELELLRKRAA